MLVTESTVSVSKCCFTDCNSVLVEQCCSKFNNAGLVEPGPDVCIDWCENDSWEQTFKAATQAEKISGGYSKCSREDPYRDRPEILHVQPEIGESQSLTRQT